jgi:3-hydroxypropanoate dehydrogenase
MKNMSENTKIISDGAMDILFREARTYNAWLDEPVTDVMIHAIHDLMKFAPTSANCWPVRIKYVTSDEAKDRLKPLLAEGNVEKTMTAPVVAIIGHDYKFYEKLPELFPHTDAKSWFVGNDELIKATAARNGTLQAAYMIMAARAIGLDCGPMSGFDLDGVTKEFFAGTDIKADLLCNIGYGDKDSLFDRSPRPDFEDVCEII